MHIGLWWENPWERDHLEYGGIDEMIILKWTLRKFGGMVLNRLMGLDRDKWQAIVNVIRKFWVP
jgi:hypothetical protein